MNGYRLIVPDSADQTLVFRALDALGAPVTLSEASAGLDVAYQRVSDGRASAAVEGVAVARSGPGVHTDWAITSIGDGWHEFDLPDAAVTSGADTISPVISADGVDLVIAQTGNLDAKVLSRSSDDNMQQALTDLDSLDTRLTDLSVDVESAQSSLDDLSSALGGVVTTLSGLVAAIWSAAERTITGLTSTAVSQLAGTRVINIGIPALRGNSLSAPIVQGDSYSADQDRQISFSRDDFPDLDAVASVTLNARRIDDSGETTFALTGSVAVATGTKVVQFEPTAAETRELTPGKYEFDVSVVFDDGNVASFVGPKVYLEVWDDVDAS